MIELLFFGLCFFGLGDCVEEPVYLEYIKFSDKYTMNSNYSDVKKWQQRCDYYTNDTSVCGDWYEIEMVDGRSWSITYTKSWWG